MGLFLRFGLAGVVAQEVQAAGRMLLDRIPPVRIWVVVVFMDVSEVRERLPVI